MGPTLAHVTHEAVEKIGGIGTVLEGLLTCRPYRDHIGRSILIGPCSSHLETDPTRRLGPQADVLYSSVDRLDRAQLRPRLHPIELAFDVSIVYGRRRYRLDGHEEAEAEVLLIDVFHINHDRLAVFKHRLAETFGIDSLRYEHAWDYEEYVRLAEPAYYALAALLDPNQGPCVLVSHEFMGMATILKATLEGGPHFRTVFHAHECATARRLVEHHPGHDTMFYNVLREARTRHLFAEDLFGDLSAHFRHALIRRTDVCDAVIAVGPYTVEEMRFLSPALAEREIDLVYNGVPAFDVDVERKTRSRDQLAAYAKALVGWRPDVLMTHVTRPVLSKGVWRDLQVLGELDRHLRDRDERAVLFLLTSAGGVRRPRDVRAMEQQYGWPRHHREGYPDLVGPEVGYCRMIDAFNDRHDHVQVILVNQFGWDPARIGRRLPEEMTLTDLRCGTDVELGLAIYEPFGISPLEPLCAGAICVISSVCGCAGFVREASHNRPAANVLVADYTQLDAPMDLPQLLAMTRAQRDGIEARVAAATARALADRLPRSEEQRLGLLETGRKLAGRMSWKRVAQEQLLPVLRRLDDARPA